MRDARFTKFVLRILPNIILIYMPRYSAELGISIPLISDVFKQKNGQEQSPTSVEDKKFKIMYFKIIIRMQPLADADAGMLNLLEIVK
ncbi:hypothetical protein ACJX0J_014360, partial [Zea mays]